MTVSGSLHPSRGHLRPSSSFFVDGQVTLRWRDSAQNNATTNRSCSTLTVDKFLRRFLLHVLPKGFVRIRNFGFLANRRRATLLPLCFPAELDLGTAACRPRGRTQSSGLHSERRVLHTRPSRKCRDVLPRSCENHKRCGFDARKMSCEGPQGSEADA